MLLGVCSLAFLFGTFTAFQHVGVEQEWWDGAIFCEGVMADFVNQSVSGLASTSCFSCLK